MIILDDAHRNAAQRVGAAFRSALGAWAIRANTKRLAPAPLVLGRAPSEQFDLIISSPPSFEEARRAILRSRLASRPG